MREYYDEFRREISLETDYQREALLLGNYRRLLAPFSGVVAPEVVEERSTRRVLTLTLLRGATLAQFASSEATNEARMRVSAQLIQSIYGPFLTGGEIHADPHPGNFLITAEGKLAVLDFGSIKTFSPGFTGACRDFFRAALSRAPVDLVSSVRAAGFRIELEEPEAQALLQGIFKVTMRPVQSHNYDYAADTISRDMRELAVEQRNALLRVRPPAEGIMFARAIAGCAQNLRALGARGDFRSVYEGLLPLLP
jgi:predicted unusual protein kinase regulating ubiquinone biosynthesis (AarF/ABC1/UbiB family)